MEPMIRLRRGDAFLMAMGFLALTAVPGCGDGKPNVDTSLTEATVTGIVSAKGVPVTGGTIHFNPSNSGRIEPIRSAEIRPDGSYTITTYTGDNQVTYGGEVAQKNLGVGLRKDYANVQRGENRFDFDVLGEGSKNPGIDYTKLGQRRRR
jgi:hypothetical protein